MDAGWSLNMKPDMFLYLSMYSRASWSLLGGTWDIAILESIDYDL